jgi:hypothetical protein
MPCSQAKFGLESSVGISQMLTVTWVSSPAVKREFGLDSSVGIAPNKLLAKLASGRAKPNGVCTVLSGEKISKLLGALPAARMPGCGGKIGDTFAGAGVGSIADLQALTNCLLLAMLPTPPTQHTILTAGCKCTFVKPAFVQTMASSGTRKQRRFLAYCAAGLERGGHAVRAGLPA